MTMLSINTQMLVHLQPAQHSYSVNKSMENFHGIFQRLERGSTVLQMMFSGVGVNFNTNKHRFQGYSNP